MWGLYVCLHLLDAVLVVQKAQLCLYGFQRLAGGNRFQLRKQRGAFFLLALLDQRRGYI